jgi:vacuolar protein sorting-associated protein 45
MPPPDLLPPPVLSNHLNAILAVLLSLKKRPVIRWERMSQSGRKLAAEVQVSLLHIRHLMGQAAMQHPPYRELFDFRPTAGPAPLLLILDRRNDPVTPLLSQWTYQAMVHELCGITNGRVRIDGEDKLELRVSGTFF